MNDNDDDLPPEFSALFQGMNSKLELQQKLATFMEKDSNHAENNVLMPLWQDIGDNTETYWQAMQAATSLVKAMRAVRKALRHHRPSVKIKLFEALSQLMALDATTTQNLERIKQEHEHGSPARTTDTE